MGRSKISVAKIVDEHENEEFTYDNMLKRIKEGLNAFAENQDIVTETHVVKVSSVFKGEPLFKGFFIVEET